MTYGCDAFLVEAAAMFGVRMRALHPPESSEGLAECPEFAQHFEASYTPLIRRALENAQPVLAWRGWPDYREALWGIITAESPDGVRFAGTVMWSGGKRMALVAPPVQFYVVEEVLPRKPQDEELMRAGIVRARAAVHSEAVRSADVVSGRAAYDLWINRLTHKDVCPTCGDRSNHCHVQHARFITSNRRSAIRFLQHYRDGVAGSLHALIDAVIAQCRGTIDALAMSRDEAWVNRLISTPDGRQALATGVQAAQVFERANVAAIDRLASHLK
ncbi:MAG: hypothetical protein IID39_09135 [Planctomycetes bacterium]|nr:hypothetical protein [Planctomycetota bacterium]